MTGLGAIALGNSAIVIESMSRRIELALYMAPKAVEGAWNFLARRGYVKNLPF